MPPSVEVLISTYNGQKYLVEQLDSILAQTQRDIMITIRDDGSVDNTADILTSYARRDKRIKLIFAENLGVVGSFLSLLKNAESGCRFTAFADQDDVWLPNKIERALSVLSAYDDSVPLLYCSRMEYVSEDLRHLGFSKQVRKPTGFANALVQNIATGCTIVLNRAARKVLLLHEWPRQVLMHDWWMYLVVSAFGSVVHDDFSSIKYRQHAGNQVGGTSSLLSDCNKRIRNFISRERKGLFGCYSQAYGFWVTYQKELKGENRDVISRFIRSKQSAVHRIRYLACNTRVYRQTPFDDIILRLLILINKY